MHILEIFKADQQRFDRFVAAAQSGSFLQSWEWGRWQEFLGKKIFRFFIMEGGQILGSVQLLQMPLPTGAFYLYAPYGPVVVGEFEAEKLSRFTELLGEKFPKAFFFRLEPKFSIQKEGFGRQCRKTVNIQPAKTLVLDLNLSEESLLAGMHHKTRYNIKLAKKHGVQIKDEFGITAGHGLYFEEALKLLVETAERQKYRGYGISYYRKLVDFFAMRQSAISAHVYKAIFKDQLLAVAIMMDFGSSRVFLFGGSSNLHKNVMAPYLLHWQAMIEAQKAGFRYYDFWGTETASGKTEGFVRFKLGFGGLPLDYTGACDFINRKTPYLFYRVLRFVNRLR